MSWFLAFCGFALLIILHELGHFTAAKAVGMRVEKFSLFFPPTIVSKRRGETEYAIGAIPAGGYVKITGMNPDEDLPDEVRDRAYHAQPVWKRIAVIAAGPAMNVLLALILMFCFFAFIGRETPSTEVGPIEKGYPAAESAWTSLTSWVGSWTPKARKKRSTKAIKRFIAGPAPITTMRFQTGWL